MIIEPPATRRLLRTDHLSCGLAVIGGGLSGVCCAITAARAGVKVILVQDRPVLGGNASSEVRLWILGATSHMGNNNRWAREGGVIDEILVENMHRNPEGNSLVLDTILLEWVSREENITLLLNTAVHDLEKSDDETIRSIRAFCSQNSTTYEISAPLFCDASGDGIVGFLAGAAFRVGAEGRDEFGELFAPPAASSDLLGHTIYFHSKDTGRPVRFTAPSFALSDITKIPRWRDFKAGESGCRLWWIEWGGALDTIHDSETIKWELWKVAYGVWDHIKNSGQFPEAETLTLEWVGTIPGKRESRRFEGDTILIQQDIVEQRLHDDAVSFGGWAIDLHPVDGVFSAQAGCTQWHSKGVYQIPWRTMYSRNITNLMLAGRIISASHVAFASTRVMATCAHGGQAVGMAAALCLRDGILPRDLLAAPQMQELQLKLLRSGQHIPGISASHPNDLASSATVTATSELALSSLVSCGEKLDLTESWAMMLPVSAGPMPEVEFLLDAAAATTLRAELRVSSNPENHTPDVVLQVVEIPLAAGSGQEVHMHFKSTFEEDRFAFVCLIHNEDVAVHLSDQRLTGVLALSQSGNKAVAKSNTQSPPPGIGIDTFEFWIPKRRPLGKNFAMKITPPLRAFPASNLTNGISRPTRASNAWVADFSQEQPILRLSWPVPQKISMIEIDFDTDFDHPMESVLMGHPERDMPFCVSDLRIIASTEAPKSADSGRNAVGTCEQTARKVVAEIIGNHQSCRVIHLSTPLVTDHLEIQVLAPSVNVPAALFAIRCFGPE
jgi:FAD dependent oxidoreductase